MGYRDNNANTRRQIANFSVDEWNGFRERLDKLIKLGELSDRDEMLLTELIVNMKTTEHLAYLARTDEQYNWLQSNQHRPMSARRIHQILTEYFPEFHIQTTHKKERKDQKLRNEQNQMRKVMITPDTRCCMCGSNEHLEIHHMFPVLLDGTNDARNCIVLCERCHKQVSLFYREQIKKLQKNGTLNLVQ